MEATGRNAPQNGYTYTALPLFTLELAALYILTGMILLNHHTEWQLLSSYNYFSLSCYGTAVLFQSCQSHQEYAMDMKDSM